MRARITSIDVRCPSCGALPGARCRALMQPMKYVSSPHETRRRRARQELARLNPEHVTGQQPLFPKSETKR